jgi:hypothetical protein
MTINEVVKTVQIIGTAVGGLAGTMLTIITVIEKIRALKANKT